MREPGFYWLRRIGDGEWTVGAYRPRPSGVEPRSWSEWDLVGDDCPRSEGEVAREFRVGPLVGPLGGPQ